MERNESISIIDESQRNGSLLSLWNAIVPKISLARRIVFSAISDLLERQNFEVHEKRKKSSRRLHWRKTEKSVWTLSTIDRIIDSPSTICLNPSVLKEILALDKELSSVLNDLNLSHNEKSRQLLQSLVPCTDGKLVVASSKSDIAPSIRSSDSTFKSVANQKTAKYLAESSLSSSSISLYSTDSITSKKSEEELDHEKNRNIIIRCNYNSESQPLNKNLIHVFRHDSSCQLPKPSCPDSCCETNYPYRCETVRDVDRRRWESRNCSRSRRKEEGRQRKREEKMEEKKKQHKEKQEKENLKSEQEKRKKERERQRKDRERQRKELRRKMKKRELEEDKEIRDREREEERNKRKVEREEEKERKENKRDEENVRKDKEREEKKQKKHLKRQEEKKRKEKEREEEKQRMKEDRDKERLKEWRCCECDSAESIEQQEERKYTDSGESIVSRDSCDLIGSEKTCVTGVQCKIPCECPRCSICCKSTQATNTRLTDFPDPAPKSSCSSGRSRFAKFLSGFTSAGRQLRLPPPEKTCRSTKSCTVPKVRFRETTTIDSCCGPPRIKSLCTDPPIKSKPPVAESGESPKILRPCKLPRCTRARSFPRLTPRVIPPNKFKPTCRLKPVLEPRSRTPSPPCNIRQHTPPLSNISQQIPQPCNIREHTPPPCNTRQNIQPPCSLRPKGPFFPPKSTRPSVSFEPPPSRSILCNPSKPSATPPYSRISPSSRPTTPSLPGNHDRMKSETSPGGSGHGSFGGSAPCSSCGSKSPTSNIHSPRNPQPIPNQLPDANTIPLNRNPGVSHNTSNPSRSQPQVFDPSPTGSYKQPHNCDSHCNIKKWSCCTKRMQQSRPCIPRKSHSRLSMFGPSVHEKFSRTKENSCSSSCWDSDMCHIGSHGSRLVSPSSIYSGEDMCHSKRKFDRPWWAPKSPSSYSFGGCSECRRRCDIQNNSSPYNSDEEFCYSRGYPYPSPWSYYPPDGRNCSMGNICYPPGYLPHLPRECSSILSTASPGGRRSCSPPRQTLSCVPPSGRTQYGPPNGYRRTSPCTPSPYPTPPCSPSYMPHPAHFPPMYPPPFLPCPPPCLPPTYPPCSTTSAPSCKPLPGEKNRKVPISGPMDCNQADGSPSRSPVLQKPKFFKEPSCLKKFSKCSGKHGMKRLRFPPPDDRKACNLGPTRLYSPCGSPTPSYGNVRYPASSRSSYGSNYCPYPCPSWTYQPFNYWPNQFQGYGGYPPCFPSQTYGGPGSGSLLSKLSLSKLKCSKLYHMSCESGFPKYKNSRSSSVSTYSSCSSSESSLSSSGSTYTSKSSSSSGSSSRSSPSYCVASCTNSSSNLFKRERTSSHSSILSSSDCSPRCTLCDTNREKGGSTLPCNSSPPQPEPNQPPVTCEQPVSYARSQVCSSATAVHYTPRQKYKVDHYDDRIQFELRKIGMEQLIKASKPAKCCKQTVLNQPSREELPYAASLASLPLDRTDIRVIRQSVKMASEKTDCNYTSSENRTKLSYYANLVSDDFENKKPLVPPEYEIRYFYFTLDDEENIECTLRKSYNKASMFRFFQIFHYNENIPIRELEVGSTSQKLDFSTSLDVQKRIKSVKFGDKLFGVQTAGKSADSLENAVLSDLLHGNKLGVGDTVVENSVDEDFLNFQRAIKMNHNLNIYCAIIEKFLESDFSFDRESFVSGILNATATFTEKINTFAQTPRDQSFFHNFQKNSFVDVACQTDDETEMMKSGGMTFFKGIQQPLPDEDGVEYLKRNNNRLVFTSEVTLGNNRFDIDVHWKPSFSESAIQISGRDSNEIDEEFRNSNQNFREAMKEILKDIEKLANITGSIKAITSNCNKPKPKSSDLAMQSAIFSIYSSETPFVPLAKSTNGRTGIVQKNIQPLSRDSSWKKISKGQFIMRMYNSINEIISEIYGEADQLATLRRNRLAISRITNTNFPESQSTGKLRPADVKTTLREQRVELSNIPMERSITNGNNYSSENLESVYTSSGKIITKFYDSGGETVKSIYNFEGQKMADSSSAKVIASVLFDNMGNFISGYYDSHGNSLKAVYDSQRELLQKTFTSEMLLISFPTEDRKHKNKRIFNSQGFPIHQLYLDEGKLLTSIYDLGGCLIRGTFLGNMFHLCPRIFDKTGKFILGRYNRDGEMIKRIFDSHGNNLQQLYKADMTILQKPPVRLKILKKDGEPMKKFFKKNKTPLTHVYDILGNLLSQASRGNSKDLVSRLFDLDGFFILGRLDEHRHLIEAVYDERGNKIIQVRLSDFEIGEMVKISKLYNFKGKLLVSFYDEAGFYLKNLHDAQGTLVESSSTGRAVKLAGRMFDMAGYFIQGRYDGKMNLIREVYDCDGYKILRVYDVEGNPIRRLRQSNKIFNSKGRQIRHFYKSDHGIITGIYDISGDLIGGVLSIEAEELAPFLFDMEGRFINTRYDSQMNLIKHVYDSKENLLDRVSTHYCLGLKRPLKTVYVRIECKQKPYTNASCSNAPTTFDGHCQTLPKAILPPLNGSKISNKSSPFGVSSSKKRKRNEQYSEERRQSVSVRCQCKIPGRKGKRISSSTLSAKYYNQKFNDEVIKNSACQHPVKRKKIQEPSKTGVHKQEIVGESRAETNHQNERIKTTSIQNQQPRKNEVLTTVMPCYESNRSDIPRSPDSLESLLDGYLQHEQTSHRTTEAKGQNIELSSNSKTKIAATNAFSNRSDLSKQEVEEGSKTTTSSDSSQGTASTDDLGNATEDAFLCNIPNAPPFILKMNKVPAAVLSTGSHPEETKHSEICSSSNGLTTTDETLNIDLSSSSSLLEKNGSFYTEIADFNMYIDGNCPGFKDEKFKKFVAKSITWIKTEGAKRLLRPRGLFMSTPTICMTGLTSISSSPFGVSEIDSRRPGKDNGSFMNADLLNMKNSFHLHSKIPRMLHPGKCKVHSKMKNIQLSPGSKGCAANKASACSGPCPADKTEIKINPYLKVSVSTTCPSLTNANPSGNFKAAAIQGNKNKNANIQASQPSMGDCMKGIKSDPGCYCGNDIVEPTPCPIRLREDSECVEEEAIVQTAEPEEEALCYCPPGEQPLLMKKSNIECDCANRRRCEDEILVEPPKEKPDVFWALTKVSLLKDGSKNFEIIDVSPVPPGYYLMPDVNNLVLVGPQPKPAKATPSKNCSCK